MSFRSELAALEWDALLSFYGRASTDGDAITVGASSGSQSAVDACWVEDSREPDYRNDGKTRVRRGTLLLLPSDVSSFATTWEAVIDSQAWAVEEIENAEPLLVVRMRRDEELRAGGGRFYKDR